LPKKQRVERISRLLRLPDGPVDLSAHDSSATPGAPGDKGATKAVMGPLGARLAHLQKLLYANGRSGGGQRLLIVLQGMDCSGKGGTIKNVLGPMNPLGCQVATFGRPTEEELAHDFLWRIRRRVPPAGLVGVFDRSHYEDVVAARVRRLVPPSTWRRRYDAINRFESQLTDHGVRLVKVFLHISLEEQRERLLARLDNPAKHWKYDPGDIEDRALWEEYRAAYQDALQRCRTESAQWYLVPADRKWYRNWAVATLVAEQLEDLDLHWPPADFDVEEQLALLGSKAGAK